MAVEPFEEQPGRDRVTSPVRDHVLFGTVTLTALYAAVRAFLDWKANPADQDELWNLFQTAGPIVFAIIGALYGAVQGARKAREKVTPVDDPYLWDATSQSWQPAQVMPRAANINPKRRNRSDDLGDAPPPGRRRDYPS